MFTAPAYGINTIGKYAHCVKFKIVEIDILTLDTQSFNIWVPLLLQSKTHGAMGAAVKFISKGILLQFSFFCGTRSHLLFRAL